MIAMVTGLRS